LGRRLVGEKKSRKQILESIALKEQPEIKRLYNIRLIKDNQQSTRQQTTTNDYSRKQMFNQRLVLDKLRYFAA